jgi:hypothetical protein
MVGGGAGVRCVSSLPATHQEQISGVSPIHWQSNITVITKEERGVEKETEMRGERERRRGEEVGRGRTEKI